MEYVNKYYPRSYKHNRDKEKLRAQGRVRDAVRWGRMDKPSKCDGCCEVVEKRKLAGHHHKGYDYPLEVVWLCHSCHSFAHIIDDMD